jgi:hypothetical protein
VVSNKGPTSVTVIRNGVTTSIDGNTSTYSVPQTRAQCQRGGWWTFGNFRTEGACVSFVSARR